MMIAGRNAADSVSCRSGVTRAKPRNASDVRNLVEQVGVVILRAQLSDADRLPHQRLHHVDQSFPRRHRHAGLEPGMAEQHVLVDLLGEKLDRGVEHDQRVIRKAQTLHHPATVTTPRSASESITSAAAATQG